MGSMGGQHLNAPMVGMAADPATGAYWEVACGRGHLPLWRCLVRWLDGRQSAERTDRGHGRDSCGLASAAYWEVASDGGIFAFPASDAVHRLLGSTGGQHRNAPVVGISAPPSSQGYWEVAADGGIFSYGVPFYGSMGGTPLNAPIVGVATG